MTKVFHVTYRDRGTEVRLDLPVRPLLLARPLRVVEQAGNHMVVGPPVETTAQLGVDVLAGSFPILCVEDGVPKVFWLEVDPPAPLTLDSLRTMWSDVLEAGVPVPQAVPAQGRLLTADLRPDHQLLVDIVHEAHAAVLRLLASWPRRAAISTRWQHVELPGGREDPVMTERLGGRMAGVSHPLHGTLPVRSARRVQTPSDWGFGQIATAAASLVEALLEADWLGADEERARLIRPFALLAERSEPTTQVSDPPMSTWPAPARRAFELVAAATAAATTAAAHDSAVPRAPICFVWRLYEAWLATEGLRAIDESPEATRTSLSIAVEGAEWIASWALPNDRRAYLCAQLHVTDAPATLGGVLPQDFRSVTSELIPDLALFVTGGDQMELTVFDAKQRSAFAMTARDCAEAASKYAWGLRVRGTSDRATRADGAPEVPGRHPDQVWIATTAYPPTMYAPQSNIGAVRVDPAVREKFGEAIRAAAGLGGER